MIPRDLTPVFSDRTRSRGNAYAAEHRVRITDVSPDGCAAVVSGSEQYVVDIFAEPGSLSMLCSCPFAMDEGACKHIWATLVIADRMGALRAILRHAGTRADLWFSCDDAPVPAPLATPTQAPAKAPPIPEWKLAIERARQAMAQPFAFGDVATPPVWPADRRIIYIVDLGATWAANGLALEVASQRRKRDGSWSHPKRLSAELAAAWPYAPEPSDRHISQMLLGARDSIAQNLYGFGAAPAAPFTLGRPAFATTLPAICDTGRCHVRDRAGAVASEALGFDVGEPWTFRLCAAPASAGASDAGFNGGFELRGVLHRESDGGRESLPVDEPQMLHSQGILLRLGKLARFDHAGAWPLIAELRARPRLRVTEGELSALLEALYTLPRRPPIDLPAAAHVTETHAKPTPCAVIHNDPSAWRGTHRRIEPYFLYGAHRLDANESRDSLFDRASLALHHRDRPAEQRALALLGEFGAKPEFVMGGNTALTIHEKNLARLIYELVSRGWRVEADGAVFRAPRSMRASLRSGIDWFELSAGVRYGGADDAEGVGDVEVPLAELLAARRAGESVRHAARREPGHHSGRMAGPRRADRARRARRC
jgi:hypothetical protein